ncbi:hypothetical protein FA95DRAFT_554517 [Auriscalpium vulgare]|uniref:Uncharacterized protein n=1 Tax=Auriscalpium vulgare TaxID=40419 RepID=A0ACB8S308_9AGAM|nr:hypothetical protein FA95DRAFT_554517 [Auriscalpium vulgare]
MPFSSAATLCYVVHYLQPSTPQSSPALRSSTFIFIPFAGVIYFNEGVWDEANLVQFLCAVSREEVEPGLRGFPYTLSTPRRRSQAASATRTSRHLATPRVGSLVANWVHRLTSSLRTLCVAEGILPGCALGDR